MLSSYSEVQPLAKVVPQGRKDNVPVAGSSATAAGRIRAVSAPLDGGLHDSQVLGVRGQRQRS